jgi:D-alanyl-D-alanine carboxypeptidase (penicillin-binding protein 5/6)
VVALVLALIVLPARATETSAREAILVDYETGTVLFEKDADKRIPPASMSKLMTAYMVFERLKESRLSLDDTFTTSENAWRKGGPKSGSSTMFLNPGQKARVEDLLRGMIVQSGNDACIVLAEGLASSERAFGEEMTAKGRTLGLKDSHFTNATGWPEPDHYMTARDLATLAMRLFRDFPTYVHYYSEKTFSYNGITQGNRNPLLYKDLGADGLKTGHTVESGYSLTATAKRGERRLVLVVTGLTSMKARSQESERLLEWGFREFNNYALFKGGETVATADVWLGQSPVVPLVIENGFTLTLPRKARAGMKVTVNYQGPIAAPIAIGQPIAKLVVTVPDRPPVEMPLVAGSAVESLGLMGRLSAALKYILWGESG